MTDIEKIIEDLRFMRDCMDEDGFRGNASVADRAIQTIRELQERNKSSYEKGVCEGYERGKKVALSKVGEFALEHGIYTSFKTKEYSEWVNELPKFEGVE